MKPRRSRRQCRPGLAAAFLCAALMLAGCSDRGQEMEEKVVQMQRQLDQAQKELTTANQSLAAANQALAAAKQAAASGTPVETARPVAPITAGGLPSRETVEASYAAGVSELRKKLDANLKDLRVDSCTVHSVQIPMEFYPFTSQISFAFSSASGKNFATDIPVKADVTGKWLFPTVEEVVERVGSAERAVSAAAQSSPKPGAPPSTQTTAGKPLMQVDGTFVIQWPEAAPRPATSRATDAATSATAPPAPTVAAAPPRPRQAPQASPPPATAPPVMPVDRDVPIQFPSPP